WQPSARTKPKRSKFPSCRSWVKKPSAMAAETNPPLPDPGSLTRGRFTYFPVVPSRVEFGVEVREAILRDRPEVIALELPVTLEADWIRDAQRLSGIRRI